MNLPPTATALVIALTACTPAPTPRPPAAVRGSVRIETLHSDALGVDKRVVVYLPAGYDARPARRWPVLYYLNGTTSDEDEWVKYGQLDHVADDLALAAIIVMPDTDDNYDIDSPIALDYAACLRDGSGLMERGEDRGTTCVRSSQYETYLTRDLVGWVDARYRTIASRDGRGIAGLSMGGYGALMIAMRHLDQFAAVASHSGVDALLYAGPHPYDRAALALVDDIAQWGKTMGREGEWVRLLFGPDLAAWRDRDPAALATKLAPGQLAIYLDCGTEDDPVLLDGARYLDDVLTTHQLAHTAYFGPGRHDYAFWSVRARASLAFLRAHTAPPTP